MHNIPLPPTWTAIKTPASPEDEPESTAPPKPADSSNIAYVHRLTGQGTTRHPGAAYFSALVDQQRKQHEGTSRYDARRGLVGPDHELKGVNQVEGGVSTYSTLNQGLQGGVDATECQPEQDEP